MAVGTEKELESSMQRSRSAEMNQGPAGKVGCFVVVFGGVESVVVADQHTGLESGKWQSMLDTNKSKGVSCN